MVVEALIKHNRPGTQLQPRTVTVHNTANPDTTARNNRDYFSNHANARVSTHYVVDDREIIRCIPEAEVSWHAGAIANRSSISIEVCEFTDEERQEQANQQAARLVADILTRYGWRLEQIKTHRDWTGKYCPRKLLPMWDEFLSMVRSQLPDPGPDQASSDPLHVAVQALQAHGLISTPDYWLQVARADQAAKGEYVYMLIIRMAQYLEQGGGNLGV
jgi:N-acetylmuramoyl-L-alanine amidase CwlA